MKVKYTIMLFGETDTKEWGEPPITEKELFENLKEAASKLRDPIFQLHFESSEVQWENPDQWYNYPDLTPEQQAVFDKIAKG